MPQPLISVIIGTFNRANILKQAVNSVLSQTYENIEIVIVDDGSTDNTYNLIKVLQKKSNKIRYFKQKNKGNASALNLGLGKSKGDFVQFLDDDDILDKNALKIKQSIFKKCPYVDAVCSKLFCFGKNYSEGQRKWVQKNLDQFFAKVPFTKLNNDVLIFNGASFLKAANFNAPNHFGKSLIRKSKILVPHGENLRAYIDTNWFFKNLFYLNSVAFVNKYLYKWRFDGQNLWSQSQYANLAAQGNIDSKEDIKQFVQKNFPEYLPFTKQSLSKAYFDYSRGFFDNLNFKESKKYLYKSLKEHICFENLKFLIELTLLPELFWKWRIANKNKN